MAIFNSAHPALSGHPAEWGRRAGESVSTATRITINGAIKLISDTKLCSLANVCAWGIGDADNSKVCPFIAYQWGLHCEDTEWCSVGRWRQLWSIMNSTLWPGELLVNHAPALQALIVSRGQCSKFGIVRPNLKCAKVQRNLTPRRFDTYWVG